MNHSLLALVTRKSSPQRVCSRRRQWRAGRRFPAPCSRAGALTLSSSIVLAVCSLPSLAGEAPSGEPGTLFMTARPGRILVADEDTFKVTGEIPLPKTRPGLPYPLVLSEDHNRFFSFGINMEDVDVVDIATRKVVDTFRFSEGNKKVRIDGYPGVGSYGNLIALPIRSATKLVDRFEISPKTLVEYDIEHKKIARTLPWPDDEEREEVDVRYSPDGKLLYIFAEDVSIYDTATLEQVDKWELSRPIEDGFGRLRFGPGDDTNEEPGFFTGMFTVDDPLQHRKMLGVARMDLAKKAVDFWTIGPAQEVRRLALAPDRKRAYALLDETGNWELWTFDLVGRQLVKRTPIAGRPRMELKVS